VFCIASVHASLNTRTNFTNIFGGALGNEGLGLGSISLDWQYIGSQFLASVLSSAHVSGRRHNVTDSMWFAAFRSSNKEIHGSGIQYVMLQWPVSTTETCGMYADMVYLLISYNLTYRVRI
jgi:hypothetical protein